MRKIVAGNWKSQKLMNDGRELINAIASGLASRSNGSTEVVVAPPAPYLALYAEHLRNSAPNDRLKLSAQQCSAHGFGAHTGEFSAEMLQSAGIQTVLIGHSERRDGFGESDAVVADKTKRAIDAGLRVILCCGEHLDKRKAGEEQAWVSGQIQSALQHISPHQVQNQVVIAYEPVWAIGTGETATAAQAQEMHAFIRGLIADLMGSEVANHVPILYGGSCKPSNAAEIFAGADVDGGLIGGASLVADDFLAIVDACDNA